MPLLGPSWAVESNSSFLLKNNQTHIWLPGTFAKHLAGVRLCARYAEGF